MRVLYCSILLIINYIQYNGRFCFYFAANLSPYSVEGGGGGGDTSPKPLARSREQKISTEKRPSKLHHANKGAVKQHRCYHSPSRIGFVREDSRVFLCDLNCTNCGVSVRKGDAEHCSWSHSHCQATCICGLLFTTYSCWRRRFGQIRKQYPTASELYFTYQSISGTHQLLFSLSDV